MTEKEIQAKVQYQLGSRKDVRLWRNNVGQAWFAKVQNGKVIGLTKTTYGLCKGSSDLIGFKSVMITPDMVGKTVAIFLAVEVKSDTGTLRPEQKNFLETVERMGGITRVTKSEDVLI